MNALISLRAWLARTPLAILAEAVPSYIEQVQAVDPAAVLDQYEVTSSHHGLLSEPPAEVLEAYYADREAAARGGGQSGSFAVVPIYGPISHRDSALSMMLSGTSTARLTQMMKRLAADDSVNAIMLNVDSPGGTVGGLPELAATIRAVRDVKPVVALVNSLGASAAYWIASQATTILATPESLTGSIGVFTQHVDCSQMMEREGLKTTYIHAGRYKVEGNPSEPLSDEARDHIQKLVDETYDQFLGEVAKGRGITRAKVKADFGEGRVMGPSEAKAAGMIDRIATYGETLDRLASGRRATIEVGEIASAFGVPPYLLSDDQTEAGLDETAEEVDHSRETEALNDELMFASRRLPRNARGPMIAE